MVLQQMFKISKWIPVMCSIGGFQTADFALVPGASETAFKSLKMSISISYSPLGRLDVSPIGCLSQTFWGLIFLVQVPRFGCLMWGTNPSLLWERETLDLWGPFLLGVTVSGVGILERLCLCLSYSSPCGLFNSLLWRSISASFQFSFSEGIVSHVAVDLVCTGGSEFRFLHHHLGLPSLTMLSILLFSLLEMPPPVKFYQFFRQVSLCLQGIFHDPSKQNHPHLLSVNSILLI